MHTAHNQTEVYLQNLAPCSAYWIVITAVNCGLRISSSPQLLDLFNSSVFTLSLCPETDFVCSDWIRVDVANKVADIENVLSSVLTSQCLLNNVTCFANSSFTCSMDDSMVTFRYAFQNNIRSICFIDSYRLESI